MSSNAFSQLEREYNEAEAAMEQAKYERRGSGLPDCMQPDTCNWPQCACAPTKESQ